MIRKLLLCVPSHSLYCTIDKAFQKEQALMKERKTKTVALIPLNLDGYLFDRRVNGKASQVRSRLTADFRGWQESHSKCEEQIEQVVRALRADEHAREPQNPCCPRSPESMRQTRLVLLKSPLPSDA